MVLKSCSHFIFFCSTGNNYLNNYTCTPLPDRWISLRAGWALQITNAIAATISRTSSRVNTKESFVVRKIAVWYQVQDLISPRHLCWPFFSLSSPPWTPLKPWCQWPTKHTCMQGADLPRGGGGGGGGLDTMIHSCKCTTVEPINFLRAFRAY